MKFLTKINRQYLLTLSIVLLLTSIAGYFLLQKILIDETKEDILEKEYAIVQEIKTQNNLPNIYPIIETKKIPANKVEPQSYDEIVLTDEAEGEEESYLEYTNTVKINNQYYLIKLRHSLVETDALILAIALPLLLLLVLAFLVLFFISKKFNKTVWHDFEQNLHKIEKFSFQTGEKLALTQTNIEEFDRLNITILAMTEKLRTDYLSLKEFTENAAHELQTPLSIISLNLEELLQMDFPAPQLKKIYAAQRSVKRLATLNKNLLLLSKLENRQFKDDKTVNLSAVLTELLQAHQPLLDSKNIKTDINKKEDFTVNMPEQLSEILLSNLLINAITHNKPDGKITILCKNGHLRLCNTGQEKPLDKIAIFDRFKKFDSQSFGLGLAIVKQICTSYHLQINYNFDNGHHCFSINKEK